MLKMWRKRSYIRQTATNARICVISLARVSSFNFKVVLFAEEKGGLLQSNAMFAQERKYQKEKTF